MCTTVSIWYKLLEHEKGHVSVQFYKKTYIILHSPNIYYNAYLLQSSSV